MGAARRHGHDRRCSRRRRRVAARHHARLPRACNQQRLQPRLPVLPPSWGAGPVSAPLLDGRTFDEIRTAVHAAAARSAPEWQPGLGDAGDALVAVFAHYLELLLARLNNVPDKNLAAFFDALGIGFLPPGAAVAPVTFTPAPTAAPASLVA